MEPWWKLTTTPKEVREGRSFNPDEFAIALEQAVIAVEGGLTIPELPGQGGVRDDFDAPVCGLVIPWGGV
jgi:hypothetical protein